MSQILVLGATGRVGGATIRELRSRGVTDIVAGTRNPEAAKSKLPEHTEPRKVDLDDASTLPNALNGIEAALLVTGYSVDMLVQSQRFLHAAKEAGVLRIVHLGASGNPTNEVAHWGWHRYVEALIEQLGFEYTHLRPEAYMQNITDFGWLNNDTLTSYIGDARWSWVDVEDIGAVAAAALAEPQEFKNHIVPIGVDAASMRELAERLAAHLGHSIRVDQRDPNEFLKGALAGGADPAYMACVARQFELNRGGLIADADRTFDDFADLVGRPPRRWSDFIASLDVPNQS